MRFPFLDLDEPGEWPAAAQLFLLPKPIGSGLSFACRSVLVLLLALFTFQTVRGGYWAGPGWFLHNLNLPIHEAGHVVFGIFGNELLTSMGGSILQVLMPLVLCGSLWLGQRDLIGGAAALWWAFENVVGVAHYAADAWHMVLPLIGGGTGREVGGHDWNFILDELGLLHRWREISDAMYAVGYAGMCLAVLWGAWALWYWWFHQRGKE